MHWRRCFDVMEFADMNLTKSLRGCRGGGRVSLLSGRFCDRQEKRPAECGLFCAWIPGLESEVIRPRVIAERREATFPEAGTLFLSQAAQLLKACDYLEPLCIELGDLLFEGGRVERQDQGHGDASLWGNFSL